MPSISMPSILFDFLVTLTLVPARSSTSPSCGEAEYALMSLPCLPLITKRVFLCLNPTIPVMGSDGYSWALIWDSSCGVGHFERFTGLAGDRRASLPDQRLGWKAAT